MAVSKAIRGELRTSLRGSTKHTGKAHASDAYAAVASDLEDPPISAGQPKPTRFAYNKGLTLLLKSVEEYDKKDDALKLQRDLDEWDDMGELTIAGSPRRELTCRCKDLEQPRDCYQERGYGGRNV